MRLKFSPSTGEGERVDENATVQCRICKNVESRWNIKELRKWEMQHLHLSDGEFQFLTCSKCKKISPNEMLEIATRPTKEAADE